MLAALSLGAVMLGVASGGLAAASIALLLSGVLAILGIDEGAELGLIVGIVAGLFGGGWLAGTRAIHSQRFHGMVTGLLLAFVIMVIARFGGSPAGGWTILWLAFVSIAVAGAGGWLAGYRSTRH